MYIELLYFRVAPSQIDCYGLLQVFAAANVRKGFNKSSLDRRHRTRNNKLQLYQVRFIYRETFEW